MNNEEIVASEFVKNLKQIYKKKKIYLHEPNFDKRDIATVSNCIKINEVSTSANSYYKKFKSQLEKFTKIKNVFLTSSGTNALHLTLKCLKLNNKDEVMLSSIGFAASLNVIMYENAIPHFLDCSLDNLGVDYNKLKSFLKNKCKLNKKKECINLITKRRIKAIIVTHVFGFPAEIDKICKICKKFNIKVIEDAAEGLGSFYKNKHLGTFGDFGILSFNGNKIITSAGGGAVLVNSKKNFDFISLIGNVAKSNHPIELYNVDIGYNYKMPNFNASLGFSQFNKINKFLKYKKNLNRIYFKRFSKFNNKLKLIRDLNNTKSNFWLQGIIVNKISLRNAIIKICIKNKIFIKPIWKPLHENKYCKKKYCHKDLSNAKYLAKRLISLPSGFGILKNEKK
tara:strand:- start:19107 stop:20294 length:1188 start_codon:yes stop_codon:yes gene_type:complete